MQAHCVVTSPAFASLLSLVPRLEKGGMSSDHQKSGRAIISLLLTARTPGPFSAVSRIPMSIRSHGSIASQARGQFELWQQSSKGYFH
jgi:hypothetical protein